MTSPIFLQVEPNGVTLTIPTAYVSFTGEALDHKIPLLRSQEALGKQALRILRWFGNDDATRVFTTIGPEQEYFLVDRRLAEQRPDLLLTGRTLFGAPSPKGQELEDQYFGSIRPRILAFMMDLDRELWRLGIPAKTRHNEVAPAPVRDGARVRADVGRLGPQHDRDVRRCGGSRRSMGWCSSSTRSRSPGINGSGKHNNWSMSTDAGENLLDPGTDPHANAQFLAFLHRASSGPSTSTRTSCGHRSPMPVRTTASARTRRRRRSCRSSWARSSRTSSSQLEQGAASESKQGGNVELGVTSLPVLPKDATDRNRTSPFAFTGNKFEFRAVGWSAPDLLAADRAQHGGRRFARRDSRTSSRSSKPRRLRGSDEDPVGHREGQQAGPLRGQRLLRGVARRGGAPRPAEQPDDRRCAAGAHDGQGARSCSRRFGVLSERELAARVDIAWERYVKVGEHRGEHGARHRPDDDPAGRRRGTSAELGAAGASGGVDGDAASDGRRAGRQPGRPDRGAGACPARGPRGRHRRARRRERSSTTVIPAQDALREVADELETVVADDHWPLPKYRELLFQY